jgi:hypothetical protein
MHTRNAHINALAYNIVQRATEQEQPYSDALPETPAAVALGSSGQEGRQGSRRDALGQASEGDRQEGSQSAMEGHKP